MSDIDWTRLPPLATLRAFEATARLKGYSAAARALNVTPAAIAQQVRKLEAEIGAPLVRREGRGLALTEAGDHLARPLSDAFGIIADGIEDTRRREASRGVRVSTTFFFVDAVILPRLAQFWADHPGTQVTFSPDGNLKPVDLDNFDICVRGGHSGETWPGYASHKLLESPIVVVAAPALLKGHDGDLGSLPWLYDRSMGENAMRDFVGMIGLDPDAMEIVDPGSARFEIEAAVMGYGLSISTELVIRRQVEEGSLVIVDTPLEMTATYSAIYRRGQLPPPVSLFLDWLTRRSAEMARG